MSYDTLWLIKRYPSDYCLQNHLKAEGLPRHERTSSESHGWLLSLRLGSSGNRVHHPKTRWGVGMLGQESAWPASWPSLYISIKGTQYGNGKHERGAHREEVGWVYAVFVLTSDQGECMWVGIQWCKRLMLIMFQPGSSLIQAQPEEGRLSKSRGVLNGKPSLFHSGYLTGLNCPNIYCFHPLTWLRTRPVHPSDISIHT